MSNLRVVSFVSGKQKELTFEVREVQFNDQNQPLRHTPLPAVATTPDILFQRYLDCLAAFRKPVIAESDFMYLDMNSALSQDAAAAYESKRRPTSIRLMLGEDHDNPSLLVKVKSNYDPNNFDFHVINGGWRGKLVDGMLHIFDQNNVADVRQSDLMIICDNQDRLRGEYNDVFANYANVQHVGPSTTLADIRARRMGIDPEEEFLVIPF